MSKSKRCTCYLLIFLFGFLYLKNLLPGIDATESNCQEIGHIHNFKSAKHQQISKTDVIRKASSDPTDQDDDDCHEGKLSLSYSPFPAVVYDFQIPAYKINFAIVSSLENQFPSPDIQIPTPPPRFV